MDAKIGDAGVRPVETGRVLAVLAAERCRRIEIGKGHSVESLRSGQQPEIVGVDTDARPPELLAFGNAAQALTHGHVEVVRRHEAGTGRATVQRTHSCTRSTSAWAISRCFRT
jgi:hypothetical protein